MTRNAWGPRNDGDPDAGAAVAAALVVGCLVVWVTGQLAGLLFGLSWLDVAAWEVPRIVYELALGAWRDPATAWPPRARQALPGPVAMSLVFLGVLGGAARLGWWWQVGRRRPRLPRSARGAQWATRWQVRHLAVRRAAGRIADARANVAGWCTAQAQAIARPRPAIAPAAVLVVPATAVAATVLRIGAQAGRILGLVKGCPAGRVVIGRRWNGWCRPLIAAEECASLLVFGPPGMFKTAGLAVCAILEWAGPLVVPMLKPDVYRTTVAHRCQRGQVWVFNPLGAGGLPANTWSPLASCRTWAGAKEMGAWLAQSAELTGQSRDDQHYWSLLGAKLLSVLCYAAAGTDRTMRDVLRWVDTQEQDEVSAALAELGDAGVRDAWSACQGREDRTRGSVYGTAETLLDVYDDPRVADSANGTEIDLDLLLSGDHTLYLYAPAHQQRRLRPLLVALLSAVIRRAQELAAASPGGMLSPRLLCCFDEAGNLAAIPDLPELATTGRGQGIQLLSIFHDLSQVQTRYGRQAATIVNGHRGKLFLAGQADVGVLELAGKLAGDEHTVDTSISVSAGGRQGRTLSQRHRPLLPSHYLRQLRPRQGVLIYGHLPPIKVRLRAWWRSPALARRAHGSRGRRRQQ
jgi:type IV secretion system protein VirD4